MKPPISAPPITEAPSDSRAPSLHAYFLRAGDPKVPIIYPVERLRDARFFSRDRRLVGSVAQEGLFRRRG